MIENPNFRKKKSNESASIEVRKFEIKGTGITVWFLAMPKLTKSINFFPDFLILGEVVHRECDRCFYKLCYQECDRCFYKLCYLVLRLQNIWHLYVFISPLLFLLCRSCFVFLHFVISSGPSTRPNVTALTQHYIAFGRHAKNVASFRQKLQILALKSNL